jgi:hypothetical protein
MPPRPSDAARTNVSDTSAQLRVSIHDVIACNVTTGADRATSESRPGSATRATVDADLSDLGGVDVNPRTLWPPEATQAAVTVPT